MVWGMLLPETFGEFWPSGYFVGWREYLLSYYRDEMSVEQKALFASEGIRDAGSYAYYVSEKMISPLGGRAGPDYPPFTPVEPQEPPRKFVTDKRYASLGSLIMLNDRILCVDSALKSLIEKMEPDIHGFYPIDIVMPKGVIFPREFFTIYIGRTLDGFLPEKSSHGSWKENGGCGYIIEKSRKIAGLAFSKPQIENCHLWRECTLRESLTCMSDEIKNAVKERNLRIPKNYKMKEV